jgi:hypothetical protein
LEFDGIVCNTNGRGVVTKDLCFGCGWPKFSRVRQKIMPSLQFNGLTTIRVLAGTKKLAVVLLLGRYILMEGTIFTCIDCFLCVVSGDLVFFASILDRKLLAELNNFVTQNGPSTHIIVAMSFIDK